VTEVPAQMELPGLAAIETEGITETFAFETVIVFVEVQEEASVTVTR
jgi:hypothetical protein